MRAEEAVQHGGGHRGDEGPGPDAREDPDHGDPEPAGEGGGVRGERTHRYQGGRYREEPAGGQPLSPHCLYIFIYTRIYLFLSTLNIYLHKYTQIQLQLRRGTCSVMNESSTVKVDVL